MTLYSSGSEVLIPKEECLTRRFNNDSIELDVRTTAQPVWAPHASESMGVRAAVLAGVINHQGEIGQLPHDRACKAGYVWDTGVPLRHLSVLITMFCD